MSAPAQPGVLPPPIAMLDMIKGFWVSRALYVAAKLGIPDLLRDEPKSSDDLAQATGTHAPSLYRVLRALDSVGVFAEDDRGRFALTPLGATLRTDVPGSLRYFAIEELGENHYPAWERVLHSVETGAIAFNHVYGVSKWQYMAEHSDEARIFDAAMSSFSSVRRRSCRRLRFFFQRDGRGHWRRRWHSSGGNSQREPVTARRGRGSPPCC
jgi:hypothetical protein